jgi:two-component system chemotaxis response regulator CheY
LASIVTRSAPSVGRILVVEDDEDTRELMTVALRAEGFAVEQAADAAEGLACLASGAYDLVVTDYDMPVKTGAAMLKEAAAQGLLGSASAVVVTAHPAPEGVEDLQVLRKPIDLVQFLGEVTARVSAAAAATVGRVPAPAPPHIEAILYISSGSPASLRARLRMEELVARARMPGLRLEVCDISRDARRAEADGVVYTPTLVWRAPGPPVRIVGDPTASPVVAALLRIEP